jgi:hypothetical protein
MNYFKHYLFQDLQKSYTFKFHIKKDNYRYKGILVLRFKGKTYKPTKPKYL